MFTHSTCFQYYSFHLNYKCCIDQKNPKLSCKNHVDTFPQKFMVSSLSHGCSDSHSITEIQSMKKYPGNRKRNSVPKVPEEPQVTQPLFLIDKSTMGIDFGKKNIGMSRSTGFTPKPMQVLRHENQPRAAAEKIAALDQENMVTVVVIGWPLNSSGEEGHQVGATRYFLEHLSEMIPWTHIYLWDERFSTIIAKASLETKGLSRGLVSSRIDSAASVQILSEFHEAQGVGAWLYQEPKETPNFMDRVIGQDQEFTSYKAWKESMIQQGQEHDEN